MEEEMITNDRGERREREEEEKWKEGSVVAALGMAAAMFERVSALAARESRDGSAFSLFLLSVHNFILI